MIITTNALSSPTTREQVGVLRAQLASTLPGLAAGASVMRAADLSGDDWQERLQQATRNSADAWRPPYATLTQVKAGVAELGTDPLAQAARQAIEAALTVSSRGLDNMGRAYMQFWTNPDQEIAPKLATFVAHQSDRTSAAIEQAVASLDELLLE